MTIDWFSPWSAEALLSVGIRTLEGLNLAEASSAGAPTAAISAPGAAGVAGGGGTAGQQGVLGVAAGGTASGSFVMRVAQMCVDVHTSAELASEQLYHEQQRR